MPKQWRNINQIPIRKKKCQAIHETQTTFPIRNEKKSFQKWQNITKSNLIHISNDQKNQNGKTSQNSNLVHTSEDKKKGQNITKSEPYSHE